MNEAISAAAIISSGRLLFAETARSLWQSVHQLGFPVAESTSPYWDQSLVQTTKMVLRDVPQAKYLFYLDGDGVFKQQDLIDMYRIIDKGSVNGKPIDAIFPVQADRYGNKPLTYNWCSPGLSYDYGAPFCPWVHGHFGCTFIRASAIKELPEPWCVGQPAPDGTWDQKPGKMDPDTYFWVKFNQHQKMAVQANHTVVGHMQVGIRWQQGKDVVWQRVPDYQINGKPYGCRVPLPIEYPGEANPCSTNGTGDCIDGDAWLHYKNRPIAHLSAQAVPNALANVPTPPPITRGTHETISVRQGYAPPEFAGTCPNLEKLLAEGAKEAA